MTVEQIVEAFADELSNWDFFSDGQIARVDDNGRIVVCLRNYNWYITREPITNSMDAIRALFEIDWIAEYDEEDKYDGREASWVDSSKYWKRH